MAILIGPILIGIAVFLATWFYSLRSNHKISLMSALVAAIAAIGVASIPVYFSHVQNVCTQKEKVANELVALILKVTEGVVYQVGIPDVCYKDTSGIHPFIIKDPKMGEAFEESNQNAALIAFKVIVLSDTADVVEKNNLFSAAIKNLRQQCSEDADFKIENFYAAQSLVIDASNKYIQSLGQMLKSCY